MSFSTRRRGRVGELRRSTSTPDVYGPAAFNSPHGRSSVRVATAGSRGPRVMMRRSRARSREWRHHATARLQPAHKLTLVSSTGYGYGFINWSRAGWPSGWSAAPSRVRAGAGAAPGAAARARVVINANHTHTCVGLSILFRFCVLGPAPVRSARARSTEIYDGPS